MNKRGSEDYQDGCVIQALHETFFNKLEHEI